MKQKQLGLWVAQGVLGAVGMSAMMSAQAQTSVTLYGIIDTYMSFTNHGGSGDGGSSAKVKSGGLSPSRWGLRGTEDLGSGAKAFFTLENGFNQNGEAQQDGRLFGRLAMVGLEYDGHRVSLGRQYTFLHTALALGAPGGFGGFEPQPPIVSGTNVRVDNSIQYVTDVGPVRLGASWGFGEQYGAVTNRAKWSLYAKYETGPVGISMAYDQNNGARVDGDYSINRRFGVAMRYKATDDLTLFAAYRWSNAETTILNQPRRDNLYWAGLTYNFTPATSVITGYYYMDVKENAAGRNAKNPWQIQITPRYAFSKRTSVYANATYSKNSALNFTSFGPMPDTLAPGRSSQMGFGVGIRHSF